MAAKRIGTSVCLLLASQLAPHALATLDECKAPQPMEDRLEEDMSVTLLQIEQLGKADERQREAFPVQRLENVAFGSVGSLMAAAAHQAPGGVPKPREQAVALEVAKVETHAPAKSAQEAAPIKTVPASGVPTIPNSGLAALKQLAVSGELPTELLAAVAGNSVKKIDMMKLPQAFAPVDEDTIIERNFPSLHKSYAPEATPEEMVEAFVQPKKDNSVQPVEASVGSHIQDALFSKDTINHMPPEMQKAMVETGLQGAPSEIVEALVQARDMEEDEREKDEADRAAQQQTANWIAAMFSDKPLGEDINGTDSDQMIEKITGYVNNQAVVPEDRRTSWSDELPPKLFFTDNRLQALTHVMELDKDQAKRDIEAQNSKSINKNMGAASRGLHQGFGQKFDLLPEPGNPEEAGQRWHIEFGQKQAASGHTISVLGHGVVEHYMNQE